MTAKPSHSLYDPEKKAPVVIDERRPVMMPLLTLLGIITLTATTVFAYAHLKESDAQETQAVQANTKELDDHEVRIRTVEAATQRMDANLQQIRDWMQEDRERRAMSRAP